MAFDEKLALKVRNLLKKESSFEEKKMFGGLCFLVSGQMCCGVINDKLVAMVGADNYEKCLKEKHVTKMDFTGRPLKGMVYVESSGLKRSTGIKKWVKICLQHLETLPKKRKPTASKKTTRRSAEKPELSQIFQELKELIALYQDPLKPKSNRKGKYDLWSFKDIVIANRKRGEVYFAGIVQQSSYVGFYYLPVYVDSELKDVFKPELLSLLKGKSCFHIKKLTPELKRQIKSALKIGYQLYRKRGWI